MAANIIHVPRRYVSHEWGGTETVIKEIATQQLAAGYMPRVETSMALASRRREYIHGVEVVRHSYCYPFFGLDAKQKAALDKKGGNLLSLPLFRSLLMADDVRMYHAHALKRVGGMVATAARLRRRPFVVSLHGGVFDVPPEEASEMTKPIKGKLEWGRAFGAVFGSRSLLEDADMVICVGKSERDAAAAKLSHDRIAYLPNGVNCERFALGIGERFRTKLGIPHNAFVVMNISRIDAQKNQLALVRAFAQLKKSDSKALLVLIGPETQPEYAEKVRREIAIHGLEGSVRMLSGLAHDNPDLLDAYDACDVFVLPSIHEPFGIVVLEAWSAGKPVITTRAGGLKSLITDGHTGLFMDSEAMLAELLLRLKQHPLTRRTLGEAGRTEARHKYHWRSIHHKLERLYQRAEERNADRNLRTPNTLILPA